jgi:nucleoside permease NupC
MIEAIPQILSLICSLLTFIIVIYLAKSNIKFTKGELQKIIEYFAWGTIFIFGAMAAQLQVDLLKLYGSPIDIIKYFFMIIAFYFYLIASHKIYQLSKVLGFASEELPKKLKKVLKS